MGYLVIVSNRSRRGSKWVDQDRSQLGRGENGCQPSQPRYVNVILMHMLYKMFITTYGCILHAYRGCQNYFFPAGTCINYMCVLVNIKWGLCQQQIGVVVFLAVRVGVFVVLE